jgi:hypothetical protein
MTTFTSTRARTTPRATASRAYPGQKVTEHSTITVAAHPVTADVYEMIKVPKGALLLGGKLFGASLVTAGTSTGYDIDVGWASNTSALGNLGVLSPAAIAGFKPELGYYYPLGGLLFSSGPVLMDRDRTLILTVNTSAASANFVAAALTLEIEYVMTGPL